jgi:hypothetical protein
MTEVSSSPDLGKPIVDVLPPNENNRKRVFRFESRNGEPPREMTVTTVDNTRIFAEIENGRMLDPLKAEGLNADQLQIYKDRLQNVIAKAAKHDMRVMVAETTIDKPDNQVDARTPRTQRMLVVTHNDLASPEMNTLAHNLLTVAQTADSLPTSQNPEEVGVNKGEVVKALRTHGAWHLVLTRDTGAGVDGERVRLIAEKLPNGRTLAVDSKMVGHTESDPGVPPLPVVYEIKNGFLTGKINQELLIDVYGAKFTTQEVKPGERIFEDVIL